MSIIDKIVAEEEAGARARAHRSNLFLAAAIEVGGASSPVKIRNLSQTGAMLEGPAFPSVGTALVLRRQALEIEASVVWIKPPRCGIVFHGLIAVGEWVSGKRAAPDFSQGRVDEIQAAIRADRPVPPASPAAGVAPEAGPRPATETDIDRRIAEELAYVRRILDALGNELSDEPIFLQRHARALQQFDLTGQILGNLANVLNAENREAAIASIGMDELRVRLLRKALFDPK
jgi:hypothetical protein